MKRKIFISINLPDRSKRRLMSALEKWHDLPVKWVKEANLHITLEFLGHIPDDNIEEICAKTRRVAANSEIFDIEFERIEIGPSEKDPRMVWLTGNPNDELKVLTEKIEKELDIFQSAKKSFRPHITLGKIRKIKWDELPEKPQILKQFPLLVSVESIEVMASDFEGGGMEYTIIESCPLK